MFVIIETHLSNEQTISEQGKQSEKCPNTELFLVRIFLYSDWIRRFTPWKHWLMSKNVLRQLGEIFWNFCRTDRDRYYKNGNVITRFRQILKHPSNTSTHSAIICSKLTIETLEQRVTLVSLLLILNIFHALSLCFYC